jgi:hypothetical protein
MQIIRDEVTANAQKAYQAKATTDYGGDRQELRQKTSPRVLKKPPTAMLHNVETAIGLSKRSLILGVGSFHQRE